MESLRSANALEYATIPNSLNELSEPRLTHMWRRGRGSNPEKLDHRRFSKTAMPVSVEPSAATHEGVRLPHGLEVSRLRS